MNFPPATLLIFLLLTIGHSLLDAGYQALFQSHRQEIDHTPILDNAFDEWIEETGKEWGMKGVAIAVTRKNKNSDRWTTETKGYGVADRWGTPVDEDTLFAIGSNSKLFTALGAGLLTVNESISVDWNTKIKDILRPSEWSLQDKIAQDHANLVDLLSHRTGLPRHDLSYSTTDTMQNAVTKLRYLRPSAGFREIFQYNNQMYFVTAHIISQLTATPFTTYIICNIISPLGLTSTTYNVTQAEQSGKLADGFVATENVENGERENLKPTPFWSKDGGSDLIAGAGGIISNAKDMATWLQTLLLSGHSLAKNESVIPSSVVEKASQGVTVATPQAAFPELSPIVYGLGQIRYTYQGHEIIEHDGNIIGHYSSVTRATHSDVGVAILTNWPGGSVFMKVIKWRLIEKALGLKEVDWNRRFLDDREGARAAKLTRRAPRASDGSPSTLQHHDLAGIYFNPSYGTISLCAYPPPKHIQPSRKECEGIVTEALRPLLNDSVPTLVAAWSKIRSTHLILRHVTKDHFGVEIVYAFPAPFPNAPESDDGSHPFAVPSGEATVDFVFGKHARDGTKYVEGIACKGAMGLEQGVEGPKGEGRAGAEVWFDRVV